MRAASRPTSVETVVVGAGQAGLLVSSLLRERGREHLVLDRRPTLGGGWQDRWDGFRLVSPNWTLSLADFAYRGPDPDGFAPRDEIVAHFRDWAAAMATPVELSTEVARLRSADGRGATRFRLDTNQGQIRARNVVVATGPFQVAHVPAVGRAVAGSIHQLHIHQYRNPGALPPGGVLVVGSGQSGVQLAEELMAAGREVTIAVGRCGRVPRTYRGRDVFWWLRRLATDGREVGTPLPTAADLPSPAARFACNPQLTGHGERHDTDLREMARAGLRLAGRLEAVDGTRVRFADDLAANLDFADTFFARQFKPRFDTFAARTGLDLPEDEPAQSAFQPRPVRELDLECAGIGTIVWTTGYRPDFRWIEFPVLDDWALPIQTDGRTAVPGLAFLGTLWLVDMASANLVGLERDALTLAPAWPS